MPIRRTYACPECNHMLEVTLTMDQVDDPPPECPHCEARDMRQEFRPVASINSSPRARANRLVEDIIANDYHAADFQRDHRRESKPTVRYKDQTITPPSSWTNVGGPDVLASAIEAGRATRLEFGSGLDVLQANLKSGAQPDLIEVSKRRSPKIW
jgi:putative FmdB family regulatory protein